MCWTNCRNKDFSLYMKAKWIIQVNVGV